MEGNAAAFRKLRIALRSEQPNSRGNQAHIVARISWCRWKAYGLRRPERHAGDLDQSSASLQSGLEWMGPSSRARLLAQFPHGLACGRSDYDPHPESVARQRADRRNSVRIFPGDLC